MARKHRLPSGNAGKPVVSYVLQKFSYYDVALAVLPIPLLLGLLAGNILSLPTQATVIAGGMLSATVLWYLLFRDPPTRRGPRERVGGPTV